MTAPRFATGTSVAVGKTKMEIDTLLAKNGATNRAVGSDDEAGYVVFSMQQRRVRLRVSTPRITPDQVEKARRTNPRPAGVPKEPPRWWSMGAAQREAWCAKLNEQEERERWRRLLLLVKAKLEWIAMGETTVEREFLADILLPDNRTVHEGMAPKLAEAYGGASSPLLLGPAGGAR